MTTAETSEAHHCLKILFESRERYSVVTPFRLRTTEGQNVIQQTDPAR